MIKSPVQSLSALKAQDIKEYLLEFISDVEGSISIEMLEQYLHLASIHFSLYMPKGIKQKFYFNR